MTDRELLELAARAAGMHPDHYEWCGIGFCELAVHGVPHCGYVDGPHWNPLKDDGDALRLAVKLGITPHQYSTCIVSKRHIGDGINCEENFDCDPYKATRRAIVRAAAELAQQAQREG